MIRKILVLGCAVMLSACASKYRVDSYKVSATADPQGSFYVMKPVDGKYGTIDYTGSGDMVQQEVFNALHNMSSNVTEAKAPCTLDEALAYSREHNIDYVVNPTILHWEDRATEWSGRPDRITIDYRAYVAQSGEILVSTTRSASSKWATFGGDHPQDLLPVPTQEFAAMLTGTNPDTASK